MKICLAQISSKPGDIEFNIQKHLQIIEQSSFYNIDCIFFPELSLTGYEPALAKSLAITEMDFRLNEFQKVSDTNSLIIGIGAPVLSSKGILIGMLIFQPNKGRKIYAKTILHQDEKTYFEAGNAFVKIKLKGKTIVPAICYEALQSRHIEQAIDKGCDIYLASVSKPERNVIIAHRYFVEVANFFSIPILMVNSIGPSDDFFAAGQSAIWDKEGKCLMKLDDNIEGFIIFDTVFNDAKAYKIRRLK